MFVENGLNHRVRNDLGTSCSEYEVKWAEIENNGGKFKTNTVVGIIYRVPGGNISLFNDYIRKNTRANQKRA